MSVVRFCAAPWSGKELCRGGLYGPWRTGGLDYSREAGQGRGHQSISPDGIVSKHCPGMATSGYLVEVEKVTLAQLEDLQRKYPEAFTREYDAASGLTFHGWVE